MITKFKLSGLTCQACAKISKMNIEEIHGVKNTAVSQDLREIQIEADREINIEEARAALNGTPYKIESK